jgi:hypothetical protein
MQGLTLRLLGLALVIGLFGILNLVTYLRPTGEWEHLMAGGMAMLTAGHCTALWWQAS